MNVSTSGIWVFSVSSEITNCNSNLDDRANEKVASSKLISCHPKRLFTITKRTAKAKSAGLKTSRFPQKWLLRKYKQSEYLKEQYAH